MPPISPSPSLNRRHPFNRKEVACFLLWVAILVLAVGIVVTLLFYGHGREPIHAKRNGAVVALGLSNAGAPAWYRVPQVS